MANRLALGQPDRERRLALPGMDRPQAGPKDLGDERAVGERERDPAQHHRLGGQPGEVRALGVDERRDAEADQVDEQDRRDAAEDVGVNGGQEPQREECRGRHRPQERDQEPDHQHTRLGRDEDPDVEPERLQDVREARAELVDVEERLADVGPAGAGEDQRREAAEDDDAGDRGDRLSATGPTAPRRGALLSPARYLVVGGATGCHAAGSVARVPDASRRRYCKNGRFGRLAHPLLLDLRQLAGVDQALDRLRDAGGERRVLLQEGAPLVAAGCGELADHGRLRDLGRGQVEGRRHVDDDRLDLPVLERGNDVVRGLQYRRGLARLDLRLDRLEARGPDLHADLRVGEVGEGRRPGEVGVLERDHRLVGLVVGSGEVDRLGALRADRDLIHVEVEVLRPGGVGGVERDHRPGHVRLGRSRARRRSRRPSPTRSPRRWWDRCPRSRAGRRACRCRP